MHHQLGEQPSKTKNSAEDLILSGHAEQKVRDVLLHVMSCLEADVFGFEDLGVHVRVSHNENWWMTKGEVSYLADRRLAELEELVVVQVRMLVPFLPRANGSTSPFEVRDTSYIVRLLLKKARRRDRKSVV